jgi:hypothetical protein
VLVVVLVDVVVEGVVAKIVELEMNHTLINNQNL